MVARCKFTEGKHGKSSHEVLAGAGRRPKTENLDPLDLSCERCSRDHDRLSEECQALIFIKSRQSGTRQLSGCNSTSGYQGVAPEDAGSVGGTLALAGSHVRVSMVVLFY